MMDKLPKVLYYLIIAPMAILGIRLGNRGKSTEAAGLHDDKKTYDMDDFEDPW